MSHITPFMNRLFASILAALLANAAAAETTVELERATILGAEQKPAIAIDLPWDNYSSTPLPALPAFELLTEQLRPLDWDAFSREVQYFYDGEDHGPAPLSPSAATIR